MPLPSLSRLVCRGVGIALIAAALGGCLSRDPASTGSIGGDVGAAVSGPQLRSESSSLGDQFEKNPGDASVAIAYARSLRGLDQTAQAVAVLQQSAIRNPNNLGVLAAYGKALADAGRFKEAADVLSRAHSPERPDWRILSVQGAVADQMGDFGSAQRFYETALRIAPGEPSILTNQGLSFALAKRLDEAERILAQAAQHPRADARMRQNYALVLGLEGKFGEAEGVLRRDLSPADAAKNLTAIKRMISQSNSWRAIRRSDQLAAPKVTADAT